MLRLVKLALGDDHGGAPAGKGLAVAGDDGGMLCLELLGPRSRDRGCDLDGLEQTFERVRVGLCVVTQ